MVRFPAWVLGGFLPDNFGPTCVPADSDEVAWCALGQKHILQSLAGHERFDPAWKPEDPLITAVRDAVQTEKWRKQMLLIHTFGPVFLCVVAGATFGLWQMEVQAGAFVATFLLALNGIYNHGTRAFLEVRNGIRPNIK